MAAPKDFIIRALTGGYNDTDPVTSLAPDQCVSAVNVEYQCASRTEHSTVATRRAGITSLTVPWSNTYFVSSLHNHLPTTDQTEAELWATATNGVTFEFWYKDSAWTQATPVNAFSGDGDPDFYNVRYASLHSKLFIAYNSAVNRLHVRDAGSSSIRKVGLDEPAAPSVADTAAAGSYTGTRYFRVRYNVTSGSTVLRRSEPSEVTTFSPSGSNTGATITKPATISESETHWEVEASLDNYNFYRIATVAVGTTTYDDTTSFSSGYANASGAVLSEDVGDYTPLHSGRFLVADDDRLLVGGSYEDASLSSRVAWTPVLNDPGVGNDERSPVDTDNFIDLDTYEGGAITDMARTVNGYIFVFKWSHIYQLTRTGQRTRAYTAHCLTKNRGALTGSVCEGVDQNGKPCLYFMDPVVGPCRIGEGGIQTCGMDIKKSWEGVNRDAVIVVRSLFYSEASQLHIWVATDEATSPDVLLVLHVNKSRQAPDGIRRGWTKFTGVRAAALSTCMFAENIEDDTDRSTILRPFIGYTSGRLYMCDTGTDDAGTAYAASIKSGPVAVDLLTEFGVMDAAVVAKAANGVTIDVKVDRNFGLEEKTFEVDLSPEGTEDPVIKYIDNFNIAEANAVQIEFADQSPATGNWNVYMFAASNRREGQG